MKQALVISLKFHPGHISHLVACYKQCEELGYEAYYYVNEGFVGYLPAGSRILVYGKDKPDNVSAAFFTFPNQHNVMEMARLKHSCHCKIVYIFHEPLTKLREYRSAGFGWMKLCKLAASLIIEGLTVKRADAIVVPSERALSYYRENRFYRNKNVFLIPLMYDDESLSVGGEGAVTRKYFSYIGTVASDHAFNEFVDFVKWAFRNGRMPEVTFLIATRSEVAIDEEMEEMMRQNRLAVHQGKPLSNDEINFFYASSLVIWNAYSRTTQSGVLTKAFMFGTPALVLKKHMTAFAQDGVEVAGLENNTDKEEICESAVRILEDFDRYSGNCRKRFLETYYYRKYNDDIRRIISQ